MAIREVIDRENFKLWPGLAVACPETDDVVLGDNFAAFLQRRTGGPDRRREEESVAPDDRA